jgi:kinesin family protein 18/19
MVILMDPYEYNAPSEVFKNRSREQHYAFDFVFDQYSNQVWYTLFSLLKNSVFQNSTKFLLEGIVNGYNATVFAYGATGAGKTYT